VDALDHAARDDEGLRQASLGRHLVIGQEVTSGTERNQWHVILDDGQVAVRPGPAPDPDITFSQDADTATAVAQGDLAARTAFVLGHITVGGNIGLLVELAPALGGLHDVFASARAGLGCGPEA